MSGLLQEVAALPRDTALFASGAVTIDAGQIRRTAAEVAARLDGAKRVYLHTMSASLFVAGLLAAAETKAAVSCPAHVQPNYLREIGAGEGVLLTDQEVEAPRAVRMTLAADGDAKAEPGDGLELAFFTSGVTGTPKRVVKDIAQIDREALALDALWGGEAGRVHATVSHQHIYGMLFRIFWPVLSRRVSEDRPVEYWESLAGKLGRGTTLISSPAHLARMPPARLLAGSAPDLVFSSGALLPFAAAQEACAHLGTLPIEVLGSTETGGIAWRRQDAHDALWTLLPGVRIDAGDDGMLTVTSPYSGGTVATGDVIEREGERFRLKGRADRIVKIDGKRVSLPRVEEALLAHPFVAAAAAVDLPQRKGALGAIVELNDQGRAALEEQGAFRLSRSFRSALAAQLEPSERPKHWRFHAIALNAQGKRVQALLRASFAEDDTLAGATVAIKDEGSAEVHIAFAPTLVWFKGHFPGEPVLPGIAQVHLAAQWAEKLWDWRPQGANLSRLKFRRIVRPGDEVRLKLTRDTTRGQLQFAYHLGDVVASEGTIGGAA
jgi:acyl-coenzyme A synthetase/AMP-(fatty) acid ligase